MALNLKVEEPGKGLVLVMAEGEVDLNSSPQLRQAMAPHLKKKMRGLIVDLSQVSYMDSSGIATLVEAMQGCQKLGMALRLAAPSTAVSEVFKMAHLEKIFEIRASREDVLKELG
ncbi:MAG: hypothetical protein A2V67_16795 [Deltaproteobacteria bacterium RBG_13_61_14]|nr:MAG: hypothetical protein A2V67_16795 [Deltaproteobacteria bacterium RBG_13_61_14]